MARRRVIKLKQSSIWHDFLNIFRVTEPFGREYPTGRIALSFKVGKKRVLVSGKSWSEPNCGQMGLTYDYYFMPINPDKLKALLADHVLKGNS